MRRAPFATGVALAAALLLTACGSTAANQAGSGGALEGTTQGLGAPADGSAPVGTTGLGTTGGPAAGGGATGTGSQGAGGGAGQVPGSTAGSGTSAGGDGSAAGGGAAALTGPGVTATTIALGLIVCDDCATANAAIGADGEDPGDQRRYYNTALAEVNGRGGVQGRKLVAVFHKISASDNINTSQQAACETFTKDNKVAVIFFRGEIIDECALKAGIIAVTDSGSGQLFKRFPNLISPDTIRFEQLGAVTVRGMVAAGWHKPTPPWATGKIGLITWQDNEYKYAIDHGWVPALQKAGLKADIRYVAVPQSDKSIADSSAAIASAVLSFRDQGIDHVFIADGPAGIFRGGGLTLQFLEAAKSQRYNPRYGFNSNNAPGDPALPADQQVGMLAVDALDLQASNDAGITPNPQRLRCYALMKKHGLKTTDAKATGLLALSACDAAWFTEAVFSRARGFTLPAVIAGAESLGTSYRSSVAFGNRLGPGRHDGMAFFRNARFDEGCSCMRYTSKPYEP